MKDCKYNNFNIRFTKDENDLRARYSLGIFEAEKDLHIVFDRCANQIVFNANEHNIFLGTFYKYIVVKRGQELNLLWTSFKGQPLIYHRKDERSFYDYLIMNYTTKKEKVLYIGNEFFAPVAAWRNEINMDVLSPHIDLMADVFLKQTQETYLPF